MTGTAPGSSLPAGEPPVPETDFPIVAPPRRLGRTGRLRWAGSSGPVPGVAVAIAAALLAGLFWIGATRLAPARVIAADATVALAVRMIAQLARGGAAGPAAADRLRAGGLAAAGTVALALAGGSFTPDLAFLRSAPGFLLLLPLAAAGTAMSAPATAMPATAMPSASYPPGRRPLAVPVGMTGAAAVLGAARVGVLVAMTDAVTGHAADGVSGPPHVALLAWLTPAALLAGPRCGWFLWRMTTAPTATETARRPPSGRRATHPRTAVPLTAGAFTAGAARPGTVTRRAGSTGPDAVTRRTGPTGPAVASPRAGRALPAPPSVPTPPLLWPSAVTVLSLVLLDHQAGPASAAFSLAALTILAVGGLGGDRGPATLPCVAVALVAAPLPLAALGDAYADQGTTSLRLLLLTLAVDAVPASAAMGTSPATRRTAVRAGIVLLAVTLPMALRVQGADGVAAVLLLARLVAVASIPRRADRADPCPGPTGPAQAPTGPLTAFVSPTPPPSRSL